MTAEQTATRKRASSRVGTMRRMISTIATGLLAGAALIAFLASAPAPSSPTATLDTTTRAERLLDRNDCWAQGPAPVIPGHAVVTLPGQQAQMAPADVGFGIWLNDNPGVLHGFCR